MGILRPRLQEQLSDPSRSELLARKLIGRSRWPLAANQHRVDRLADPGRTSPATKIALVAYLRRLLHLIMVIDTCIHFEILMRRTA